MTNSTYLQNGITRLTGPPFTTDIFNSYFFIQSFFKDHYNVYILRVSGWINLSHLTFYAIMLTFWVSLRGYHCLWNVEGKSVENTAGIYQLWSRRNNNYSINIQRALLMDVQTYRNLNISQKTLREDVNTSKWKFNNALLFKVPQRTRQTSSITFGIRILMNFIIYLQIGRGETESRSNQEAAVWNVGSPTIVLPLHVGSHTTGGATSRGTLQLLGHDTHYSML